MGSRYYSLVPTSQGDLSSSPHAPTMLVNRSQATLSNSPTIHSIRQTTPINSPIPSRTILSLRKSGVSRPSTLSSSFSASFLLRQALLISARLGGTPVLRTVSAPQTQNSGGTSPVGSPSRQGSHSADRSIRCQQSLFGILFSPIGASIALNLI